MANTLIPIQTYTLSSSAASVTFSNIPQNYTDLKLVISPRSDGGTTANDGRMTFNGSASGYSSRLLYGLGSGTPSSASNSGTYMYWINSTNSNGLTASTFSNTEIYIPNYTSSNQKSVSCDTVTENNGTYGAQLLTAGLWTGTSAITSISFSLDYGNFVSNSTFTLYGISNGVKATGGTLTVAGGYAYHTFTSTGSFLPNQKITGAEIFMVGGGAGGGGDAGGSGGGAGGVLQSFVGTLSAGTAYTCLVGAGGVGYWYYGAGGPNATDSIFISYVSYRGSGSQSDTSSIIGSGSGQTVGGSGPGGTGGGVTTSGQGNNGGTGQMNGSGGSRQYLGGGGGGAGAVGGNASGTTSGAGGAGTTAYSTWLNITGTGVNGYIAAGGGGGAGREAGASGVSAGAGGAGGGGQGGNYSTNGVAGTANTGSGGGGGTNGGASVQGATGGSGLVIIRYPLA